MQGGVCKTRTEMKYSCRAGFTNQIWKFYDKAMISTASLIRKRCCQDVYEFVVPFGFTNFVVPSPSFTMLNNPAVRSRDNTFYYSVHDRDACVLHAFCMHAIFSAIYTR